MEDNTVGTNVHNTCITDAAEAKLGTVVRNTHSRDNVVAREDEHVRAALSRREKLHELVELDAPLAGVVEHVEEFAEAHLIELDLGGFKV